MISLTLGKKLSQATTTAVLGFAMLAAIGTDQALAVNLKTFKISGTFSAEPISGLSSSGLAEDLQNGSFDGTYTVDVDLLPVTSSSVPLENWNIDLRDASQTVLKTFSNSPNQEAFVTQGIFFNGSLGTQLVFGEEPTPGIQYNKGLIVGFNDGFTGTDTAIAFYPQVLGTLVGYAVPNPGNAVGITYAKSEPVPEPFTLGGTAVAGAIGLWMKRKQKASIAA